MKKLFFLILFLYILSLLQTSFLVHGAFTAVNLVLIMVVLISYFTPQRPFSSSGHTEELPLDIFASLFGGLFLDVSSSYSFVFSFILLYLFTIIIKLILKTLNRFNIVLFILILLGCVVCYDLSLSGTQYVLKGNTVTFFPFWFSSWQLIFSEIGATLLFGLLGYFLFSKIIKHRSKDFASLRNYNV